MTLNHILLIALGCGSGVAIAIGFEAAWTAHNLLALSVGGGI